MSFDNRQWKVVSSSRVECPQQYIGTTFSYISCPLAYTFTWRPLRLIIYALRMVVSYFGTLFATSTFFCNFWFLCCSCVVCMLFCGLLVTWDFVYDREKWFVDTVLDIPFFILMRYASESWVLSTVQQLVTTAHFVSSSPYHMQQLTQSLCVVHNFRIRSPSLCIQLLVLHSGWSKVYTVDGP